MVENYRCFKIECCSCWFRFLFCFFSSSFFFSLLVCFFPCFFGVVFSSSFFVSFFSLLFWFVFSSSLLWFGFFLILFLVSLFPSSFFLVWSGLVCSQGNFSSLGLALLVLLDWRLKASDRVLHLHNLSQAASAQNLQRAAYISPNNTSHYTALHCCNGWGGAGYSCVSFQIAFHQITSHYMANTGCFFNWYPPKKFAKPR